MPVLCTYQVKRLELTYEEQQMSTYKVTLEIEDSYEMYGDALTLEHNLSDLLNVAVLRTLNLTLVSSSTTKKRG
jgi:hypothetical protein